MELAKNYVTVANTFKEENRPNGASIYYANAANIYTSIGNYILAAKCYNDAAMIVKDSQMKILYLRRATRAHSRVGSIAHRCETIIEMIKTYIDVGDISGAKKYLRKCRRIARRYPTLERRYKYVERLIPADGMEQ